MSTSESNIICRVRETFRIKGRGLVLIPDAEVPQEAIIRIGSPVQARIPGGETFDAHIRGIEMISFGPGPRLERTPAIMLDPDREVPVGAEVWSREGEIKVYTMPPEKTSILKRIASSIESIFGRNES